MHVIATAGHVDHGKSTLVRALTGIDPDRLAEEKRRGLTIDLGFAWLALPSGRQVGIVDVPGHEKFIKNMLAGVGAINVNLFIVAANEGWKPQSQEHLDILNLLNVSSAIVVITKVDLVQQETLEMVRAEIEGKLAGTTLEKAPILEVSATQGSGLDQLTTQLDRLLDGTPAPPDNGRPRLWIDRVFSIKGSGTVVTGTLTGGALEKGQEVEILPDGERARIRGIQSHKKEVASLLPGNRAALNLSGLEHQQLKRGDILTRPGKWLTSKSVVASIEFLERLQHEPAERGAFKLYSGSVELDAQLRFLEKAPQPGESATALIRLDRPTVLDFGDRFILRDSGRRETLGGGRVLEAHPVLGRSGRRGLAGGASARLLVKDRKHYLQVLLEEAGYLTISDISRRTGLTAEEAHGGSSIRLPGFLVSKAAFDEMSGRVVGQVRAHQAAHELDAGMSLPALRSKSRIEPPLINELLGELVKQGRLVEEATTIRTPDFKARTESPEAAKLLAKLDSSGASPPRVADIDAEFGPNLVKALVREGRLVQVSPELVFSASWMSELKTRVAKRFDEDGPFTVADFRDLVQTTRKFAVPLVEYLDQIGFTRREGDLRTLGPTAARHSNV